MLLMRRQDRPAVYQDAISLTSDAVRTMDIVTDSQSAPVIRCLIIANPAAGRIGVNLVQDIGDACARHCVSVSRRWTRSRGHAVRLASAAVSGSADDEFLVVVAVGGDGTAHDVACGMVLGGTSPQRHALLVIPAGTGNSTYRALWGDLEWPEAIRSALADPVRRARSIDLAMIVESGQLVLLGAGAGLTAQVLDSARDVKEVGPGRLQAGLERALADYVPYAGRVTIDGTVVHEGPTLFANVGGGPFRAWQYLVLPDSVLDDGLLDVCVVGTGIGVGFDVFQDLMRQGRHVTQPGVQYRRGRTVVLERTDGLPLCFEHDGELVADPGSRVTLEARPGLLPVLSANGGGRPWQA